MNFVPMRNSAGTVKRWIGRLVEPSAYIIVTTNTIAIPTWYDAFAMITGHLHAHKMIKVFTFLKLQRWNYEISICYFEIAEPIEYV